MILSDYFETVYKEYLFLKRRKVKNFNHDVGMFRIVRLYDISNMEITTIKHMDAEKFLLQIEKDRDISSATVNRYRSMLSAMFNYAIRDEILVINPIRNIRKYKEDPRSIVLSFEDIKRLLTHCKLSRSTELYYIVIIALYTGMRYSEVVFMMKSRLKDNVYTLRADETKSKKGRVVAIHSECWKIINEFMNLYPTSNDRIFTCSYFDRSFRSAKKKSNLESIRFHDLRRTFATHLMEKGVPVPVIQSQLGHSSLMMTELYLSGNLKKRVAEIEKLCYE